MNRPKRSHLLLIFAILCAILAIGSAILANVGYVFIYKVIFPTTGLCNISVALGFWKFEGHLKTNAENATYIKGSITGKKKRFYF